MSKVLYAGNLLSSTTADDLHRLFGKFGTVASAKVQCEPGTDRSLGFGFVDMAEGAEAAIATLNGAPFQGRTLVVNEAQQKSEQPAQDRFSGVIDVLSAQCDRREGPEFRQAVHELQELAEAGHPEAAQELAEVLALPGPYHDPESAYKWYYIALSQQGYAVQFDDQIHTPPHYGGPPGDFRNESMVSSLVETLGFDKVRFLDAEAAHWLAERNLN
jgi:hypothetical protein